MVMWSTFSNFSASASYLGSSDLQCPLFFFKFEVGWGSGFGYLLVETREIVGEAPHNEQNRTSRGGRAGGVMDHNMK